MSGICFKGALLKGADFSGATLVGCDFRGAWLKWANFEGADLTGILYDETTVWPEGFTPPGVTGEEVTHYDVLVTRDDVDFRAEVSVTALTAIDAAKRDYVASEIERLFEGWIGTQLAKDPP
jgi:uncharacterized protein YjbI with pentapeptide repeats